MEQTELNLFKTTKAYIPLSHQARVTTIEEFAGYEELLRRHPWLKHQNYPGLILWGPPGRGKTTLAYILAKSSNKKIYPFNAVLGGVAELKKIIQVAKEENSLDGQTPLIFIDEIHRFNKAQQDALLPYIEKGEFSLIGATTENPRVSVNKALLSRVRLVELQKPNTAEIEKLLIKVIKEYTPNIPLELAPKLAQASGGDVRQALNAIEAAHLELQNSPIPLSADELFHLLRPSLLETARDYDLNGERHYDVISAFIKSIRGSDPDAAVLWLATMLEGGEDPLFIARRLVILASEDIGNADPSALPLAIAALNTVQNIGLPECRLALSQATLYLASTVKSNASYNAINLAMDFVKLNPAQKVPEHLKNRPTSTHPIKYQYPHENEGQFIDQQYSPVNTPIFYRPKNIGREKNILERLNQLWKNSKYKIQENI